MTMQERRCSECGELFTSASDSYRGRHRDRSICHRERVELPCLCCGRKHWFSLDSNEANGVFNVFCDGECEDRYAARL